MVSNIIRAVIMGAPGSGKGTISERIIKKFGFKYFACGDILRENVQSKTPLGKEAQRVMAMGLLVPDELVIKCILEKVQNIKGVSWLLDGFPRTLIQAKSLDQTEQINLVINLVVPHDVIIDRIQSRWIHVASGRVYNTTFNTPKVPFRDDITGEELQQREDDRPNVVQKRLNIYEEMTKPVIDYYREKKILVDFTGSTSNEIWPKIEKYLNSIN